jgi:formate dehydrogenase gamma subunit
MSDATPTPSTTATAPTAAPARPQSFKRFTNRQRLEHFVMMVSIIMLTLTGLPQKYPDAGWAETIVLGLGGIDTTRAIHRLFGAILALAALEHLTVILASVLLGRARATMVITRKDVTDAIQNLKYCLGVARQAPQFDRYDYKQKFEYWGLIFGTMVMVFSGLALWFPTLAARYLPAEVIPTSKVLHTNEAMLATLVVVVWHMYGAHLSPEVFPADTSIFTGRISRERLKHEHFLEYQRLTADETPAPEGHEGHDQPAAGDPPRGGDKTG